MTRVKIYFTALFKSAINSKWQCIRSEIYLAKHGNSKLKSGHTHINILIFDLHTAFCFRQVLYVCLYGTSGLMTAHVVFMEMKETKHVSNHSYSDCSRITVASSLYPLSHLLAGQLRNRSEIPGERQQNHFQARWHNCENRSPVRPKVRNNLIPTGRIFMKFGTWVLLENLWRKFKSQ